MANKKIVLIIIVIAAVIIAFSGWVLIKNQNKQKIPNQNSSPISSTSSLETNNKNTKTYRNEEFGFEFEYPKNWTFKENVFSNQFSKFNLTGAPPGKEINPFFSHFLVNIVTPIFVDNSFSDLKGKDITITGISGKKYEYQEERVDYIAIIIPINEYKMILGATKEYETVFNQILASFKFLK